MGHQNTTQQPRVGDLKCAPLGEKHNKKTQQQPKNILSCLNFCKGLVANRQTKPPSHCKTQKVKGCSSPTREEQTCTLLPPTRFRNKDQSSATYFNRKNVNLNAQSLYFTSVCLLTPLKYYYCQEN